jgi:hypothetical protein
MLSLISFLPGTSRFGLIFESAHAAPNQLQSGIRTSAPDWFELSIAQLIVRDKEVLDFVYDYGIEIRDRFELGALMRGVRHPNQPIVPEGPPLLSLVSFDQPIGRAIRRHPTQVGTSMRTRMSKGSPSSAKVEGTNPKSKGKTMPEGMT